VNSVELAVKLLGLQETYHLVLSLGAMEAFNNAGCPAYKELWRRSIFCATASQFLAHAAGQPKPSEAFCAGLLHDIGRLALAQVVPQRYVEIDPGLRADELLAAEREMFFLPHTEVGYILATTWALPEQFAEAIRFHHNPSLASEAIHMVNLVAVAAAMTDDLGNAAGSIGALETCLQPAEVLKLDANTLASVRDQALAAMKPLMDRNVSAQNPSEAPLTTGKTTSR
jgi:putative nucleotidyltransferase with HDIG domain